MRDNRGKGEACWLGEQGSCQPSVQLCSLFCILPCKAITPLEGGDGCLCRYERVVLVCSSI